MNLKKSGEECQKEERKGRIIGIAVKSEFKYR